MRRRHLLLYLLLSLICVAPPVVTAQAASAPQPADAQSTRVAVASLIGTSFATDSLYRGKRVVFDTTRPAVIFQGEIRPEHRPAVPRPIDDLVAVAISMGGSLARPEDLPHCDQPRGKPPTNCSVEPIMSAQVGEPVFKDDTAFVVFRLSTVLASPRPSVWNNQLTAVLLKAAERWRVVLVLGHRYPR